MPTQHNVQAKLADLPQVSESFGDSIRQVWFDGTTWRIQVDVIRMDDKPTEAGGFATTQYPSCRLVLSGPAGLALLERLTQLAKELEASGTLKRLPPEQTPTVTH
jgi:hypothetical protein